MNPDFCQHSSVLKWALQNAEAEAVADYRAYLQAEEATLPVRIIVRQID